MSLLGMQSTLRNTLFLLVVKLTRRLRDEFRRAYSGAEFTSRVEVASLRDGPKDMENLYTLAASYCCVIPSPPITRRLLVLFSQWLFKYLIRPLLFHLKKGPALASRLMCHMTPS